MSSAAAISTSSLSLRNVRRGWPRLPVGMPLVRDQARCALGPRAARLRPDGLSADGSRTHRFTCRIAGYGAFLGFDERAGADPASQATVGAVVGNPAAEQSPARRRSC